MDYKFDIHLVPNVLSDQGFQSTGLYTGTDGGVFYAVIDPRRHNVNVWSKGAPPPHSPTLGYRLAALRNGSHYASNGPPMAALVGSGAFLTGISLLLVYLFPVVGLPPWDRVISRGRVLATGQGITKSYFARSGQGSFANYSIAYGSAPFSSQEALSGVYRLVANSSIVNDNDTPGLHATTGIASWGLRPIGPPEPTDGWLSEIAYIDDEEKDLINGVIIAAATNQGGLNSWMASGMLTVGCNEAVAMDGSDSVVCVSRGAMKISCAAIKDTAQRWGLYCG